MQPQHKNQKINMAVSYLTMVMVDESKHIGVSVDDLFCAFAHRCLIGSDDSDLYHVSGIKFGEKMQEEVNK